MNEIPRANRDLEKEIAREAKDLMANRAFTVAIKALKQQWIAQMLADTTSNDKVFEFRAMLKALDAIPAVLSSLMYDQESMRHGQRR